MLTIRNCARDVPIRADWEPLLCAGLQSSLALSYPHLPDRDGRVLRAIHVHQARYCSDPRIVGVRRHNVGRMARRWPKRGLHPRPVHRGCVVQDRVRECRLQRVHEPRVVHGSRMAHLLGGSFGLVRGCAASRLESVIFVVDIAVRPFSSLRGDRHTQR